MKIEDDNLSKEQFNPNNMSRGHSKSFQLNKRRASLLVPG